VLELVGAPAVVGDDPALAAHADRLGRQRLAAGQRQPACPHRGEHGVVRTAAPAPRCGGPAHASLMERHRAYECG
jgi:hypothetical protein